MVAAGMEGLKTSTLGPKSGWTALAAVSGDAQTANSPSIRANRILPRRQRRSEKIVAFTFPSSGAPVESSAVQQFQSTSLRGRRFHCERPDSALSGAPTFRFQLH